MDIIETPLFNTDSALWDEFKARNTEYLSKLEVVHGNVRTMQLVAQARAAGVKQTQAKYNRNMDWHDLLFEKEQLLKQIKKEQDGAHKRDLKRELGELEGKIKRLRSKSEDKEAKDAKKQTPKQNKKPNRQQMFDDKRDGKNYDSLEARLRAI